MKKDLKQLKKEYNKAVKEFRATHPVMMAAFKLRKTKRAIYEKIEKKYLAALDSQHDNRKGTH